MSNAASKPDHYTEGDIECIDAIEASMSPTEFQGYCKGNVIKYVWRYRMKGGKADLKKAQDYLQWLAESVGEDKGDFVTAAFSEIQDFKNRVHEGDE